MRNFFTSSKHSFVHLFICLCFYLSVDLFRIPMCLGAYVSLLLLLHLSTFTCQPVFVILSLVALLYFRFFFPLPSSLIFFPFQNQQPALDIPNPLIELQPQNGHPENKTWAISSTSGRMVKNIEGIITSSPVKTTYLFRHKQSLAGIFAAIYLCRNKPDLFQETVELIMFILV